MSNLSKLAASLRAPRFGASSSSGGVSSSSGGVSSSSGKVGVSSSSGGASSSSGKVGVSSSSGGVSSSSGKVGASSSSGNSSVPEVKKQLAIGVRLHGYIRVKTLEKGKKLKDYIDYVNPALYSDLDFTITSQSPLGEDCRGTSSPIRPLLTAISQNYQDRSSSDVVKSVFVERDLREITHEMLKDKDRTHIEGGLENIQVHHLIDKIYQKRKEHEEPADFPGFFIIDAKGFSSEEIDALHSCISEINTFVEREGGIERSKVLRKLRETVSLHELDLVDLTCNGYKHAVNRIFVDIDERLIDFITEQLIDRKMRGGKSKRKCKTKIKTKQNKTKTKRKQKTKTKKRKPLVSRQLDRGNTPPKSHEDVWLTD
uniref:Uncharacterized protein n=1 Tax=viral metagenome TaxID=1070528 RepID=A0A6C0I3Q9_9ZZZZ